MSTNTGIEWTDATWNPIRGCSRVSEGCRHCYAETVAARFSDEGMPYHGLATRTPSGPRWTGEVRLIEEHLTDPLRWRKPRKVFVNSMSDLFHESVPDEWIDRIFVVMALAPQHTFQVLTKRAERMRAYVAAPIRPAAIDEALLWAVGVADRPRMCLVQPTVPSGLEGYPLPNVWLGVSVEDQQRADERIPLLLQTPAAVRFISAEPLLGPVDLTLVRWPQKHRVDVLRAGTWELRSGCVPDGEPEFVNHSGMERLDWVIVGGESGSGARPCDVAWVRDIVRQCCETGVSCFVKQLGADPRDRHFDMGGMPTFRDRKGGDPSEWPKDLRVRNFPLREATS